MRLHGLEDPHTPVTGDPLLHLFGGDPVRVGKRWMDPFFAVLRPKKLLSSEGTCDQARRGSAAQHLSWPSVAAFQQSLSNADLRVTGHYSLANFADLSSSSGPRMVFHGCAVVAAVYRCIVMRADHDPNGETSVAELTSDQGSSPTSKFVV